MACAEGKQMETWFRALSRLFLMPAPWFSLQRDPAAYEVYANLDDLGPDAQIEEKLVASGRSHILKASRIRTPP